MVRRRVTVNPVRLGTGVPAPDQAGTVQQPAATVNPVVLITDSNLSPTVKPILPLSKVRQMRILTDKREQATGATLRIVPVIKVVVLGKLIPPILVPQMRTKILEKVPMFILLQVELGARARIRGRGPGPEVIRAQGLLVPARTRVRPGAEFIRSPEVKVPTLIQIPRRKIIRVMPLAGVATPEVRVL